MTSTPLDDPVPGGDRTAEAARKRRRRTRGRVLAVLAIVVAAAAAVLPHLGVPGGGLVPAAQALIPVGVVMMIALVVVAGVARAWVAAIVLVVGAVAAGIPVSVPQHGGVACNAAEPFTMVSFNAKFARADPAEFAALIRSSEADAVALLETDEALIDALLRDEGLAAELPYRTREVRPGAVGGSVLLSAHELSAEEDIGEGVFDQVSAIATLPDGGEVRLAAVHPPPPIGQPQDWEAGVADVGDWVAEASDARLIVAGDLNASYAHPVFRSWASSLRSAAEAAGPIPWPTWPEEKLVPAFTAIDHVLVRGALPTGWESHHITGSDHRAVVARFSLCAS